MGKFLAILSGAAGEAEKASVTERKQAEFMAAWASWAQANEQALVDPGAPLFRKKRVTAHGVESFEDAKVAYAIVETETHDHAVDIFRGHPHLTLGDGNSIEIIECPAIPGQAT